jgi:hypothetical protein
MADSNELGLLARFVSYRAERQRPGGRLYVVGNGR